MLFLSFLLFQNIITQQEEHNFVQWMKENNLFFVGTEYSFRLGIFITNKRRIDEHNRRNDNSGFLLSTNHLTHLTESEYKSLLGTIPNFQSEKPVRPKIGEPCPLDYRDYDVVNPIKDQMNCGSCWAFSIIAAEESNYALRAGRLMELSEQNLIDCCGCSFGCAGGIISMSMMDIIDRQKGLFMLEDDYPYTGTNGACKFDIERGVGRIVNVVGVAAGNEVDLAVRISEIGVASAVLDASHFTFQAYSQGIYNERSCSATMLDHGVAVVGFSNDYWIIRNCWGVGWGEKGYMRLARNHNNMCGVATMASFPIV